MPTRGFELQSLVNTGSQVQRLTASTTAPPKKRLPRQWNQEKAFDRVNRNQLWAMGGAESVCREGATLDNIRAIYINNQSVVQIPAEKVRMCYYSNWAQYRTGEGKFVPQDIDPFVCTHILYAFAKIDQATTSLAPFEWNDDKMYKEIMKLKKKNRALKVLLAVGGASHPKHLFSQVAGNLQKTEQFVSNAIQYLRRNEFDGLDIDWEFPAPSERRDFQRFMKALYTGFQEESQRSNKEKLLLTIATTGNHNHASSVYGPAEIASSVDYILLMTYDFWGAWSQRLSHQSPLRLPDNTNADKFSMVKTVETWKGLGAPADKLVLGLALYARSGMLLSKQQHNIGDPWTKRNGPAGKYTKTAGFIAAYEVCDKLKSSGWNTEDDKSLAAPYAWNANTLEYVCYDTPSSFQTKAKYILDEGLGGAMFWALDMDDFSGQFCGRGTYPFINVIKDVLGGS
ncbi:chitinase-3-like protein 1 [Babylonia areolata]|uniref:chitinase-3-like protein 1 n=1 Tax=Babylonia areolata TaxID=304850 RepID=UPI003FD42C0E